MNIKLPGVVHNVQATKLVSESGNPLFIAIADFLSQGLGVPCGRNFHYRDAPLSEVERYYIEQALSLAGGNREEASRMLGIGERTLYRVIQDWKLQDRIRQALGEAGGDVGAAAKVLGIREQLLERKLKKWGLASN